MPLADGLYIVSGHHHDTGGLANENRWVGVKIEGSFAEWLQVDGPKARIAARAAAKNPLLESCTGTGAVAMGTPMGSTGKRMQTLKQQRAGIAGEEDEDLKEAKKKSKKEEDDEGTGQVILGGEPQESVSYEERLLNRVTKTIVDTLDRRRQYCIRCRCERTFAEAEGDRMRCIVCTHTLYRADSHFSVIRGKGMYSPPPTKKAIREWEPGEDVPDYIVEMMNLDPKTVADLAVKADEGPTANADRETQLKQRVDQRNSEAEETKRVREQTKAVKQQLNSPAAVKPQ